MGNFVNSQIQKTTKALNKKGQLKGKEQKGSCLHFKITSKGKKKGMIDYYENYGICRMCQGKINYEIPETGADIDAVIQPMKDMNDTNKYLAVASDAGDETVKFYSRFGVMLNMYKKPTKKMYKIVQKQSEVGNKKNKNKNKNGGGTNSSNYGSWGIS